MEFLRTLFFPIVYPMRALLVTYADWLHSAGLAIVLLALTLTLLTLPLQRAGRRLEWRIADNNKRVREALRQATVGLKGEALFDATEAVYRRHAFHPIHNMLAGASFFCQLPFLLAAVILFTEGGFLQGERFGLLADLSAPDGLFAFAGNTVNMLPVLVLLSGVHGAYRVYANDARARKQWILIAFVLFALIYNMPSGLVLYWTVNSVGTGLSDLCQRHPLAAAKT